MATPVANPLTSFFFLYTAANFPNTLQWHNFLQRLHNMVLHGYKMQWLHADGSHCDDPQCLVIPSSKSQHCRSDWCANLFHDDAVHAISAAIDSQPSLHPIRPFAGCPSRRSLAAIAFACRSHAEITCRAITIATSRICDWSQHLRAARLPNGSVRFLSS